MIETTLGYLVCFGAVLLLAHLLAEARRARRLGRSRERVARVEALLGNNHLRRVVELETRVEKLRAENRALRKLLGEEGIPVRNERPS